MRFLLIIALLSIFSFTSYTQDKLLIAPFTIVNGDTFFIADIPEVEILALKIKTSVQNIIYLKGECLKYILMLFQQKKN